MWQKRVVDGAMVSGRYSACQLGILCEVWWSFPYMVRLGRRETLANLHLEYPNKLVSHTQSSTFSHLQAELQQSSMPETWLLWAAQFW